MMCFNPYTYFFLFCFSLSVWLLHGKAVFFIFLFSPICMHSISVSRSDRLWLLSHIKSERDASLSLSPMNKHRSKTDKEMDKAKLDQDLIWNLYQGKVKLYNIQLDLICFFNSSNTFHVHFIFRDDQSREEFIKSSAFKE